MRAVARLRWVLIAPTARIRFGVRRACRRAAMPPTAMNQDLGMCAVGRAAVDKVTSGEYRWGEAAGDFQMKDFEVVQAIASVISPRRRARSPRANVVRFTAHRQQWPWSLRRDGGYTIQVLPTP